MLRTSFGRIRPGHPTTSYPGVAQLVACLLWEHILPIHERKSPTPQPAGTLPEAGTVSAKSLVKKRP